MSPNFLFLLWKIFNSHVPITETQHSPTHGQSQNSLTRHPTSKEIRTWTRSNSYLLVMMCKYDCHSRPNIVSARPAITFV